MIRLTKQTDYGIVLMTRLAASATSDTLWSASELAEATRLPTPMVSKILKRLVRGGLLDSQRGARGGYSLSRPATDVTVAQIVAALEGPIAITECVEESTDECTYESFCGVRANWQRINQAVQDALDAITLSDMVTPLPLGQLAPEEPPLVSLRH